MERLPAGRYMHRPFNSGSPTALLPIRRRPISARWILLVLFSFLPAACSVERSDPCDGLVSLQGTDQSDQLDGGDQAECVIGGVAPPISISMSAVYQDSDQQEVGIRIESDDDWVYAAIPGDSASEQYVEYVQFGDEDPVALQTFVERVDRVGLSPDALHKKVIDDATVTVSGQAIDSGLRNAVAETIRLSTGVALCAEPQRYPGPDVPDDGKGFGPDEEFSVGFYGPPENDREKTKRDQYEALSVAGLLTDTPIASPNGDSGVHYGLTWDGWSLFTGRKCFHYGYRELSEVTSYRATGRIVQGMDQYAVTAATRVRDAELWATLPEVSGLFPGIKRELDLEILDGVLNRMAIVES